VTVIKRFRFLFITSFYRRLPINLTVPLERFDLRFPGFTHDTHGVEIEDGTYRITCIRKAASLEVQPAPNTNA
jgi:hypothetical protein